MALGPGFDRVLEAARVGADWAWRALYADSAQDLLRYARASRAPDPEDVVGDTFLRAVDGLATFEGSERAFRAWLFTMARNRIIDDHRKVVRRRTEVVPIEVLAEIVPSGRDRPPRGIRTRGQGPPGAAAIRRVRAGPTPA